MTVTFYPECDPKGKGAAAILGIAGIAAHCQLERDMFTSNRIALSTL